MMIQIYADDVDVDDDVADVVDDDVNDDVDDDHVDDVEDVGDDKGDNVDVDDVDADNDNVSEMMRRRSGRSMIMGKTLRTGKKRQYNPRRIWATHQIGPQICG